MFLRRQLIFHMLTVTIVVKEHAVMLTLTLVFLDLVFLIMYKIYPLFQTFKQFTNMQVDPSKEKFYVSQYRKITN